MFSLTDFSSLHYPFVVLSNHAAIPFCYSEVVQCTGLSVIMEEKHMLLNASPLRKKKRKDGVQS